MYEIYKITLSWKFKRMAWVTWYYTKRDNEIMFKFKKEVLKREINSVLKDITYTLRNNKEVRESFHKSNISAYLMSIDKILGVMNDDKLINDRYI